MNLKNKKGMIIALVVAGLIFLGATFIISKMNEDIFNGVIFNVKTAKKLEGITLIVNGEREEESLGDMEKNKINGQRIHYYLGDKNSDKVEVVIEAKTVDGKTYTSEKMNFDITDREKDIIDIYDSADGEIKFKIVD